ncbi:hypothetical protein NP493_968g01015 [Ridgeia piscesae]|uniref:Uncharacterized protein n=1 Tax=Ridgeia piscesae TaxID=27915 RepID=A0AAD9NM91_RIDPI|nr:hypothetical protein NP493_968g01015 [Ridgeia piscesae]
MRPTSPVCRRFLTVILLQSDEWTRNGLPVMADPWYNTSILYSPASETTYSTRNDPFPWLKTSHGTMAPRGDVMLTLSSPPVLALSPVLMTKVARWLTSTRLSPSPEATTLLASMISTVNGEPV